MEDYDNGNLTVTEVTSRFGLSVFFLIFNLIVSAFAIMLTGSMLLVADFVHHQRDVPAGEPADQHDSGVFWHEQDER